MFDLKEIIDDDGTIYHTRFKPDKVMGDDDIAVVKLFIKKERVSVFTHSTNLVAKLFNKKIEGEKKIYYDYVNIHNHKIDFYKRKPLHKHSLEELKGLVKEAIKDYKSKNLNLDAIKSWSGILSNDEATIKKLNRSKKLNDLLGGDYDKLEKFLDDNN